ncbi:MAG: DUF6077 domain-containing protein [Streptomycetales bacterium]
MVHARPRVSGVSQARFEGSHQRLAGLNHRLVASLDLGVDFVVVALAAWTVIYHVCLVSGLAAQWAALFEVAVLPFCLWLARRAAALEPGSVFRGLPAFHGLPGFRGVPAFWGRPVRNPLSRVLAVVAAVAAVTGAALFAAHVGPWWLTWSWWILAAAAATACGMLPAGRRGSGLTAGEQGESSVFGTATVLAWAFGLAVLSLFVVRVDSDDAFYVHLTTWVSQRGSFPLRDTLYSELAYPALYWPPVSSFEGLLGTLARGLPISSPDLVYLIVPPVGTFLATLALWRLLRAWGVAAVGLALTLALLYLLTGGERHVSLGNFFLGRMWQGKVLFVAALVPLLYVYAGRFAARPSRIRAIMLASAGIAGVGLTSSAAFIVPLVVLAGVAPLLFRSPGRALAGFAAGAGYALGVGVVVLAAGGYVPDRYRAQQADPAWLIQYVFGDGGRAAITLLAVLVGGLLVPRAAGRVIVSAAVLLTGLAFAPGVPELIFDATGLSKTLWRLTWVLPVAALVGVLGVAALRAPGVRVLRFGVPVLLAGALVVTGLPIWSSANDGRITATPQWKRPQASVDDARQILNRAWPGDTILAPGQLKVTLAVMSAQTQLVDVRGYYTRWLRNVPGAHAERRLYLRKFSNGWLGPGRLEAVPRGLKVLDVEIACVRPHLSAASRVLQGAGYTPMVRTPTIRCYESPQ